METVYYEPIERNFYLIKNKRIRTEDEQTIRQRQINKNVNLICGVDIDYLESLRKKAGLFAPNLASLLGISLDELRDYISYDKICPISFAENWALSILNAW